MLFNFDKSIQFQLVGIFLELFEIFNVKPDAYENVKRLNWSGNCFLFLSPTSLLLTYLDIYLLRNAVIFQCFRLTSVESLKCECGHGFLLILFLAYFLLENYL